MAKTSEAKLKAIRRYKDKLDEVRFSVARGNRDEIKRIAKEKGYEGMQPYIIALIEADSGLQLTKSPDK